MKLLILLVCLLSVVLAEPPVGEGYPAATSHGHDHSDITSLSQDYSSRTYGSSRNVITEYSPPKTRNSPSNEYGAPNARSSSLYAEYSVPNGRSFSISDKYGAPDPRSASLSSEYGPPNARTASPRQKYAPPAARVSFSQTYGAPKNRGLAKSISQEYQALNGRNALSQDYRNPSTRSDLSQEYGAPNSRPGPSLQYGVPNTRSGISQEYGTPAQRSLSQEYGAPELSSRTLSTEYGVPDARSTPSEEYGAPAIARSGIKPGLKSFGFSSKPFRSLQAQGHTAQLSPKSASNDYAVPSAKSNELPQSFGSKSSKNVFGSRSSTGFSAHSNALAGSLPFSSSALSARDSDSYSQEYKDPSESYGVPAMELSVYGAPSERSLSREYGVPSSAGLKTKAIASSYPSARSPSSYIPSVHGVSEQYGLPEQYDALSNQGYNYAAGNMDDSDQDPANYDFAYKVNDYASGSDFGHTESRQENHAEGSYFVVLPDGTKQIVEYEADEGGFKPRISVEPAHYEGYDENASDLARSDGPY